MLGIMIGVAAVITMVALGTGAQQTVSEDVQSAGTNLIQIRAGNFTRGGESVKIATGLGSATTLTIKPTRKLSARLTESSISLPVFACAAGSPPPISVTTRRFSAPTSPFR